MPIQPMTKKVPCECRRTVKGSLGKMCDECQRRECFEWQWEKEGTGTTVVFNNDDRDVIFNPGFSVGTAAVRGTEPLKPGYHHYWEVEMSTEVYGTDMMIGVGTEKTDLRKFSHNFVSLLGIDEQSWGLSYSGEKKHGGKSNRYSKPFGQNSIIGVHLDLWAGTLEFYIDRKPLGLAFEGLRDKVLYPIISSTAARSGMNLIFCRSYPQSLQLQAMLAISKSMCSPDEEENASLFKVLSLPPGLKAWMKNNYWWIVSCRDRDRKREEELNNRARSDREIRKQKAANEAVDEEDSETDEEHDEFEAHLREGHNLDRRQARRRIPQQCTQLAQGDGSVAGGTTCMQFLAAATGSRAHFLGRVSPIFVGMPEGGFSVLSNATPSTSTGSCGAHAPAPNTHRPAPRARSASAQPGCSSGLPQRPQRQPSSSEDEDNDEGTHSTRKEPKRLRLRASIESDETEKKCNDSENSHGN